MKKLTDKDIIDILSTKATKVYFEEEDEPIIIHKYGVVYKNLDNEYKLIIINNKDGNGQETAQKLYDLLVNIEENIDLEQFEKMFSIITDLAEDVVDINPNYIHNINNEQIYNYNGKNVKIVNEDGNYPIISLE